MSNSRTGSIWEGCDSVEQVPGKVSGAWVFTGTRVPISTLFANLVGEIDDEFFESFPTVGREQVNDLLEHLVDRLHEDLVYDD